MKILYLVINGEISGGNLICLKIIEEALKRGHKVVVNSPNRGRFTHILEEKGIKVYNIDTRRTFRVDNAIKLSCIIKKENIDLVHSHTPLGGIILSRLAASMAGVPVINHAHALDFISLNPIIRWYQFSLNWVTSRFFCSKVIAVSCAVKREIIKQGVAVNRISVIYNGINLGDIKYDVNTDKFYNEFNLKPNTRIIGQVGRFHEAKGQHILIKAAKDILNRFPDTIFMFVGEGLGQDNEYAQQLEKLVSDLNLKQRIIFTGYRSDVLELINMFDLFVFPSFFFEGLPLAILEAMAAKKPVITTLIGGNPEIVIDGKTGTIVPPLDPAKLADAIIYHLENPEISQKMGQAGFERVKQYFSLSNMLDEIFSVYVFKS